MWTVITETRQNGRLIHLTIEQEQTTLTYAQVLARWQSSQPFRAFWVQAVKRHVPFVAYKWETPPITMKNVQRPFECVFLDTPYLDRTPDPHAFADQFPHAVPDTILQFQNLGGDATMLVPYPSDLTANYCHLASFIRYAPLVFQDELWQKVGTAVQQQLTPSPLWLSTAGGGVPWLHVRLDQRPKYYGYQPYRSSS